MSAPSEWIDGGVGETRLAFVENDRPVALRVLRWSEEGRRARWGEVYVGRVRSIDRPRRGAFVDLGLSEETAFLPLDLQGRAPSRSGARAVREGELVTVEVSRESARGKGPVVRLLLEPGAGAPRRLAEAEEDQKLRNAPPAPPQMRAALDEAFETALSRQIPLRHGGLLSIEPTAALTAIDVDAGARPGSADSQRFVRDLNAEAAQEIARQLRLRSIGGLVVIDFINMQRQEDRRYVEQALRTAFKGDPSGAALSPISRFGLLELSRTQHLRPLREVLFDQEGALTAETAALSALRALEREALYSRGKPLTLKTPPAVAQWLSQTDVKWRDALTRRIGTRFTIESARDLPLGRMEVLAS